MLSIKILLEFLQLFRSSLSQSRWPCIWWWGTGRFLQLGQCMLVTPICSFIICLSIFFQSSLGWLCGVWISWLVASLRWRLHLLTDNILVLTIASPDWYHPCADDCISWLIASLSWRLHLLTDSILALTIASPDWLHPCADDSLKYYLCLLLIKIIFI